MFFFIWAANSGTWGSSWFICTCDTFSIPAQDLDTYIYCFDIPLSLSRVPSSWVSLQHLFPTYLHFTSIQAFFPSPSTTLTILARHLCLAYPHLL